VSYYCKEKKNLHAAQSTGIYWAGLYRSPSQKMPRNEKAAKKENGKEKAKEKKKEGSNKPRGSLISFSFPIYATTYTFVYTFFSPLDLRTGNKTSTIQMKRESEKGLYRQDYGSQSEKGMKKNLKNIRVALMSGAEIPEHVQQRME
jgi:hypothetical protein